MENDEVHGVFQAMYLLTNVQLVENGDLDESLIPVKKGDRVIIIGGGNVAMDAARTCVRLGAESVTVAYRRSQEQMPALLSEYEEARAEGVQFQWFASPVAVEGKDKVEGFKYEVMALNDDGAGIHGTGNFQVMPVDKIIIAAGHKPNARLIGEGNNLQVDDKGYIITAEDPYGMTNRKGVFAGGDVVHKPATVVLAMREAKKAVDAGASVWVHAYNGMRGLTHRELGMVGAMYELPHTYAELICDGHHVDPKACDILLKQKGVENIALITDCMTAGGLQDGDYIARRIPSCGCKWYCTSQIYWELGRFYSQTKRRFEKCC